MTDQIERDERRNRIAIAASFFVGGVSLTIGLMRVSPSAVLMAAGRSQVGRALRRCR